MRRVFIAGGSTTNFIGKGNPNFIWSMLSALNQRCPVCAYIR